MNRSKSTNIFNSPSYTEYFNCEDIEIEDCSDRGLDDRQLMGDVDMAWVAIFEEKENRRNRKKKLTRGFSNLEKIGVGKRESQELPDQQPPSLKQKHRSEKQYQPQQPTPNSYPIPSKPLTSQFWAHGYKFQPSSPCYPQWTDISNTGLFCSLENMKQEQSTREESLFGDPGWRCRSGDGRIGGREIGWMKNGDKKQKSKEKPSDKDKEMGRKMLEYEIQIDRLSYEVQGLKALLTDRNDKSVEREQERRQSRDQSRDISCSYSTNFQQELEILRQNLMEQVEAKDVVTKERDMLIGQLSEALKMHDSEQNGLKQEITMLKEQLSDSVEKSKSNQNKVQSLSQLAETQSLTIQSLKTSIAQLTQKLDQTHSEHKNDQQQVDRLTSENGQLNSQIDMLVDRLRSAQQELLSIRQDNVVYRELFQEKEEKLGYYKREMEGVLGKLDTYGEENQELRRRLMGSEGHCRELEKVRDDKVEEVSQLYGIVDVLTKKNEELITQLSNQASTPSVIIKQTKQYDFFLSELNHILGIPQDTPIPPQSLLHQITKILDYNNLSSQSVSDYRQILQMFNIPSSLPNCHDRLLTEIGEFRNNMGVLVKKVRSMEKKMGALGDENRRLMGVVRRGFRDGVEELEKLVQEQNDEIIRYRMHLRSVKMGGCGRCADFY